MHDPSHTRTRTPVLATLVVLVASTLLAPATASAAESAFTVRDGVSQPVYSFADAIRETVWVDTGRDDDGDGKPDRVAVDIVRPKEAAADGHRVPVIMDASPYYSCCGRGNESQRKTYDAAGRPVAFPLFYDNYFVPLGYAVVLVDLAGTNRSQGCVDVGGAADVGSARSVVDWLNGRGRGYDAKSGGTPVNADWTTGAVGMIGKSYDGTIANGVAATGVAGLRTIVPISAISSWYDYYRSAGASFGVDPVGLARNVESEAGRAACAAVKNELVAGAPANGDVTPMWTARDYVRDAGRVRASVFAIHGLGDLNVKTVNLGQWWNALARNGVNRKLWLSQTGHVDPFDFRRAEWVSTLHRWFDKWLLGVDNGIDREPAASVERAPDHWAEDVSWPPTGTTDTTLRLTPGAVNGLGTLGTTAPPAGATATFTDAGGQDENRWARDPAQASSSRLLFDTGTLASDLRLSGTGSVTITATSSASAARLSAVLVDYGPAVIRDYASAGEGIKTLNTSSCWGQSTVGDSACYRDTATTTRGVDLEVFGRGWADLGHYASPAHGTLLTPGTPYTMTFRLSTVDHLVKAGHRLALVVGGTDGKHITDPPRFPTITVDAPRTSVSLPILGGADALRSTPGGAERSPVRAGGVPTAPMVRLNRDN